MHVKKWTMISLITGIIMSLPLPASAGWDRERKGFILGVAGGTGFVATIEEPAVFGKRPRKSSPIFNADAQIGYAPTNQFELYLMGNSTWFSRNGVTAINTITGEVSRSSAFNFGQLTGIGFTYYPRQGFLPPVPSPFVSFGFGLMLVKPLTSNQKSQYGFGITAGGGYEFSNYMRLHGKVSWGNPNAKINGTTIKAFPLAVRLLIGIQGY